MYRMWLYSWELAEVQSRVSLRVLKSDVDSAGRDLFFVECLDLVGWAIVNAIIAQLEETGQLT